MAEDVVSVAPGAAKVLFENDRVRVIQLKLKGRQKMAMHSHPANFVYAITSSRIKSTSPEGKTQDLKMKKGDVGWSDGGSHKVQSLKKKTSLSIVVELK